jgi:hypothetical protein
MKFNGIELTAKTIQLTREWFADNAQACIAEVKNGSVRVNDPESYFKWQSQMANESLLGEHDHTFTFAQRAYFIQTGECVSLFS